jgi:NADH:ubiquinone oxidoreductase subunit 6 (subunit J)
VLVAGTALVAVVAVVADGAPLRAPDDDGRAELPDRLLSAVEVAVLVGGALVLVAMIVMTLSGPRNRRGELKGRRALFRTLLAVVALAFLASAFMARRDGRDKEQPAARPTPVVVTEATSSPTTERPTWPLALLGAAVVVALGTAGWAARRQRPRFDGPIDARAAEAAQRAAAGAAFAASLADLEDEPDPRRAIVAAYARLLDGLEAAGFGRRPAEAPEEHLRRVLEQLQVPEEPLRTVVALFAEARFSQHPLTAAHKRTAIDAFVAARDALAGLAPAGQP